MGCYVVNTYNYKNRMFVCTSMCVLFLFVSYEHANIHLKSVQDRREKYIKINSFEIAVKELLINLVVFSRCIFICVLFTGKSRFLREDTHKKSVFIVVGPLRV